MSLVCFCADLSVCTHPDVPSQCFSTVLSELGENTLPQSSALHRAVCTEQKEKQTNTTIHKTPTKKRCANNIDMQHACAHMLACIVCLLRTLWVGAQIEFNAGGFWRRTVHFSSCCEHNKSLRWGKIPLVNGPNQIFTVAALLLVSPAAPLRKLRPGCLWRVIAITPTSSDQNVSETNTRTYKHHLKKTFVYITKYAGQVCNSHTQLDLQNNKRPQFFNIFFIN